MSKLSGCAAMARMSMLAGAAALALSSLTTAAQAFPTLAPAPVLGGTGTVQYNGDGSSHHMRRHNRYGVNAHPDHPGQAGLYDCGPGGKNTRLSRRACGGNNRFRHLQ